MILISHPYIYDINDRSRLAAKITINDKTDEVWLDVEQNYRQYLCDERSDAFVVGVLFYAMKHNHDIRSEAPMSERLHYQLSEVLIPSLCKGSPRLHRIQISCPIDSTPIENAGAVGASISCGIDSFNTIAAHDKNAEKYPSLSITHLVFNNVGSNGEDEVAKELYAKRKKRAQAFCTEYNYKGIFSDSNIMNVVRQSHLYSFDYTCGFAILCLQKLYGIYYLASGDSYHDFTLKDNDLESGSYDLLFCECISTATLHVYSDGGELNRYEKTERVTHYEPSYKYLNVCVKQDENCCKCEKCIRTIGEIDTLGMLENYRSVFKLHFSNENRKHYLRTIYRYYFTENIHSKHYRLYLYPFYKKEITLRDKIAVWYQLLYERLQYYYWKWLIKPKEEARRS